VCGHSTVEYGYNELDEKTVHCVQVLSLNSYIPKETHNTHLANTFVI